ncbi:MAG: SusC/RagA family TonB-linked outer membrane protein [Nonlabens sp.]
MKTKLNGILTLLLALVVQVAFAQQTVSGTVTDPDGLPILGATILVKDTQVFATTDFDGKYTIEASPEQSLVVSFTGYDSKTVLVGSQSIINVQLSTVLDEVVIISDGYRDIKPRTSAIASTTTTSETIENRPNASLVQRLQGQVPGLAIQTASGQPGANSFVRLRGQSSINGNSEPLFVIDGIPVDEDDFRSLNPNDIESLTTLRDASATAIYGNRGANGVIVITTRTAKFEQPLEVSYSAQTGFSIINEDNYDRYGAKGYLRLENRRGVGTGAGLTPAEIDNFNNPSSTWVDEFFRTGITNSHNLSLSAGGQNTKVFTSLNYTDQEGILKRSDLQRFNLRNNVSGRTKDNKLNYSTNLTIGYSKNNTPNNLGTSLIFFDPAWGAYNGLPYLDPADYDPAALVGINAFNVQSAPYVLMDNNIFAGRRIDQLKIVGGISASYKITPELTANYQAGLDYSNDVLLSYEDPRSALSRVRTTLDARVVDGNQTESYTRDFRFNSKANLTYNNVFGETGNQHSVTAAAYIEYIKAHLKTFNYTAEGLDPRTFAPGDGSSYIGDNANDDFFVPVVGSGKNQLGLFSYFGTLDYNYNEKYGVSGTIRRDASSRFSEENKWGTFWSAAAFWNIDSEGFMSSLKESRTVDVLKLRVSHGSIGNDRVAGGYYGGLNTSRNLFATGQGYSDNQTFVLGQIGVNLFWETITTSNIGIDFSLFYSRLRGSVELYNKESEDLFLPNQISAVNNGLNSQNSNFGNMVNKGVELELRYDLLRDDRDPNKVNLEFFGNVSYNQNEVTEINAEGGIVDNTNSVIEEGRPLNEFFVIPYVGVNPSNGQALYLDINGNVTENPTNDDRRATGGNDIPSWQGGFGFDISYKNFFLSNQWSFITGIERFDFDLSSLYDPQSIGNTQLSSDLDRAWTPTNRITDIPSLSASNLNAFTATSDRFLYDSSFLRLRFLQFGYNFPDTVLDDLFISKARIWVSGENLATFTKWRGFDPESSNGSSQTDYPTPSIFSVGLDLTF